MKQNAKTAIINSFKQLLNKTIYRQDYSEGNL